MQYLRGPSKEVLWYHEKEIWWSLHSHMQHKNYLSGWNSISEYMQEDGETDIATTKICMTTFQSWTESCLVYEISPIWAMQLDSKLTLYIIASAIVVMCHKEVVKFQQKELRDTPPIIGAVENSRSGKDSTCPSAAKHPSWLTTMSCMNHAQSAENRPFQVVCRSLANASEVLVNEIEPWRHCIHGSSEWQEIVCKTMGSDPIKRSMVSQWNRYRDRGDGHIHTHHGRKIGKSAFSASDTTEWIHIKGKGDVQLHTYDH